jgi:hypothetical protein
MKTSGLRKKAKKKSLTNIAISGANKAAKNVRKVTKIQKRTNKTKKTY